MNRSVLLNSILGIIVGFLLGVLMSTIGHTDESAVKRGAIIGAKLTADCIEQGLTNINAAALMEIAWEEYKK